MVSNTAPITAGTSLPWWARLMERMIFGTHWPDIASRTEPQALTAEGREEQPIAVAEWFGTVLERLESLPWDRPDWSSENPQPLDTDSVARLVVLLLRTLPSTAPPPDIIPNWDGGVQASWEYGDVYLEAEFSPGQEPRWAFVDERKGCEIEEDLPLKDNDGKFEARVHTVMEAAAG